MTKSQTLRAAKVMVESTKPGRGWAVMPYSGIITGDFVYGPRYKNCFRKDVKIIPVTILPSADYRRLKRLEKEYLKIKDRYERMLFVEENVGR